MSLVIAQVFEKRGYFLADSLVSYEHFVPYEAAETTVNGDSHCLKLHVLSPEFAIAFAGSVDLGLATISAVAAALADPTRLVEDFAEIQVVQTFRKLCMFRNVSFDECEFLVMQRRPDATVLVKIASGLAARVNESFVGDHDAYRALLSARAPMPMHPFMFIQQPDGTFVKRPFIQSQFEIDQRELRDALERVCQSRRFPTVGIIGSNVVEISSGSSEGFEYGQMVNAGVSPEEGTQDIVLLSSKSPLYGLGLYYRIGRQGYLMVSGSQISCVRVQADSLQAFLQKASDHGLTLEGPTYDE